MPFSRKQIRAAFEALLCGKDIPVATLLPGVTEIRPEARIDDFTISLLVFQRSGVQRFTITILHEA